ncbi:PREDICTED: androgen-induced gene 1 protein isoform X2 [Rhagoletis zephyria]|uniref:androgen-induced gene 1 protein isoform X2 n=1 Tax=Rhagoletis zephyria TaxID=28612 RepID=UPI00081136CD|nr:PREDICTED: androgen-induced gene 1 protein isoform X2 [Rhagoletis zephyria]
MVKGKSNNVNAADALHQGVYKALRTLVHITAAVQFSYAVYYDYTYVKFPETEANRNSGFGGKFKYLTFLDAIIQSLYYIISLINDFVGTNEVAPKRIPTIRKVKDYLMSALAFPVALNVGITFWTLYAIDRELVFPRVLDAVFPSWLNHVVHTNIVVFIILELFTSFRAYPKRSQGITGLAAFMLSYLVWIHVVKHYSGVWVYPVLEVLQLPQRVVFFVAVLAFTLCLYLLGEFMNNIVWAKELKLAQRKIK